MEPKVIDDQLYWHYSQLKNWEKNDKARLLSETNWLKLLADIKKNGIDDVSKIGEDGTVYDGNHRLKAIKHLVDVEGLLLSQNDKDLTYIPVIIKHPQTEADKWRIALIGNSQYAQWNDEELANFKPEFENELDLALINVDFGEPLSFPDERPDTAPTPKDPSTITCPSCKYTFDPAKLE